MPRLTTAEANLCKTPKGGKYQAFLIHVQDNLSNGSRGTSCSWIYRRPWDLSRDEVTAQILGAYLFAGVLIPSVVTTQDAWRQSVRAFETAFDEQTRRIRAVRFLVTAEKVSIFG